MKLRRGRLSGEEWALVALLVAAAVVSLTVASIGWSHALSDWWGWRQTQTAITAYYMQQGGPWLRYETPVLGPPWRVPHEFPLYQAVVVTVSSATGLPLEPAGRAVSLAFFYAALAMAFLLLGELGVSRMRRLPLLAIWLVSPLYLFWSRTFLIESTALCLCLTFLTFTGRYLRRGRSIDALVAVAAGSLGAAVKPPTVVVFVALAGIWWLVSLRAAGFRPAMRHAFGVLVVFSPPAMGWLWQRYQDTLKGFDSNPLTWGIASPQLWGDWIVAPGARLEADAWLELWRATIPDTVGHPAVVGAAAVAVILAGRRRALFALCVSGFLAHYALFTLLDRIHAYYWYAMGLFLVAAVGFAVVGLLERGDARRHLAWVLMALVGVASLHTYTTKMLPIQRVDAYEKPQWHIRLARAITDATRPEDVLIGFGMAWNPELPYYAKRRGLMWPDWGDLRPDSKDVAGTLANLRGYDVGALVSCTKRVPEETLDLIRERWGLVESPDYRGRCRLWVRPRPAAPADGEAAREAPAGPA